MRLHIPTRSVQMFRELSHVFWYTSTYKRGHISKDKRDLRVFIGYWMRLGGSVSSFFVLMTKFPLYYPVVFPLYPMTVVFPIHHVPPYYWSIREIVSRS